MYEHLTIPKFPLAITLSWATYCILTGQGILLLLLLPNIAALVALVFVDDEVSRRVAEKPIKYYELNVLEEAMNVAEEFMKKKWYSSIHYASLLATLAIFVIAVYKIVTTLYGTV